MARDMAQDGHARLGIGGAAAQQAAVARDTREGWVLPLRHITRRRGIDAGVETEQRTGCGTGDLNEHGNRLAGAVAQQARLQPIFLQPGMRDVQNAIWPVNAAA